MAYTLPKLPDNQRWVVTSSFNYFLIVKLQEKGRFFWWTIASSTGLLSGGDYELSKCVKHIINRDYYDRLMAERDARYKARKREIPFGIHGGS